MAMTLLGMVMFVKLEQYKNRLLEISVMLLGMLIDVKLTQNENT